MAKVKIKGHEFETAVIRDSHARKALLFKNKIIQALGRIGVAEDDIDLDLLPVAIKKVPAIASWYLEGQHMHYSYRAAENYASNLAMVCKIIEQGVEDLTKGTIKLDEFVKEFSEDDDVVEKRKKARELIGVSHDTHDLELINKKYKALAKEHHPDKDQGSTEKFKEINDAHKTLKRELE